MPGFTRSSFLVPLLLLSLFLHPLANAQSPAQGRPQVPAQAPIQAPDLAPVPVPAQGRPQPSAPSSAQAQAPAQAPSQIPAQGRPQPSAPIADQVPSQVPAQGRPRVYSCPRDNGVQYTTPNGITYELKCGQGTTAKRIDNDATITSQKTCADHCSEHPDCQSADWNANPLNCARFSEYIPTIPMEGVNTWFPLEKRVTRPEPEQRTPPECPASKEALAEYTNNSFVPASSEAQCPDNDGKIFVTLAGTYYQIKCNTMSTTADFIASRPLHDLADCIRACGDVPGCASVTFGGGKPSWDCKFYGTEVAASATDPNNKMAFAYVIDPPTAAKPDDLIVSCATECPMADGQTWDAPNGQKFHMDCCKRHGITIIDSDQIPDLKTCMTACSMVNGCTSVDWHKDSSMCYFGKHSGEPMIAVPGWASAHSIGCTGACKQESGCCK